MNAQVAFTFDVDCESVWLAEDPVVASRPATRSQGGYEVKRGLQLVLNVLHEYGVHATFFIPGVVAQEHQRLLELILDGGHEVGHHGHTHRSPTDLSEAEEREEMELSVAALRSFGVEPAGYRAPSWELTEHTLPLARQAGFTYSSNLMDDVFPYRHDTGLVELPVHWVLDDAAHFWFAGDDTWLRKISTNSEVNEILDAEFDGITELGGACIHTFHPQIIGRPGRLPVLRHAIERALGRQDVDVLTAGAIAATVG